MAGRCSEVRCGVLDGEVRYPNEVSPRDFLSAVEMPGSVP